MPGEMASSTKRGRHLVLLLDGTWVSASRLPPGEQQSNIYWLNLFVQPQNADGEAQFGFYISGIGSASRGDRWLGGTFAHGLDRVVEEAYVNIVSNYAEGDKIYIFGFSRGAVVARIVAYLISTFGVLKRRHIDAFSRMWANVKGEHVDIKTIRNYSSPDVPIEVLGLFDTVKGKLQKRDADVVNKLFQSRKLPKKVKTAVHILAMHESRIEFEPILFDGVEEPNKQHLEQIWMPGVHSDIGGGYTADFLSTISLITMLDRVNGKLKIDEERLSTRRKEIWDDYEMRTGFDINNELGKWWHWPLSRIYGKFGWKQRKPIEEGDKNQYYHPIFALLNNRYVRMKSGRENAFMVEELLKNKGWPTLAFSEEQLPDAEARIFDDFLASYSHHGRPS